MLKYACIVDQGLNHKTNDDCALVNHNIIDEGHFYGKSTCNEGIFAVADGVGSQMNSFLASRKALEFLSDCSPRKKDDIPKRMIQANQAIVHQAEKMKLAKGTSSTLCAVSVLQDRLLTYNLGNSRAYRFRAGILMQLTKDQKKIQVLIDEGELTEREAMDHPEGHIITGYIGHPDFKAEWIEMCSYEEAFEEGDYLIIMSDGVHDLVETSAMEDILSEYSNGKDMAEALLDAVYEKGARDNISIVIVEKTKQVEDTEQEITA